MMTSPYQKIKIPQVDDLKETLDEMDERAAEAAQYASDLAMVWAIVTSN